MAHNRGVGMRGVDAGASESELSAYIQVLEGRHRSLSEQYTDCFTSSAWVVSPIACVLAVVAGRAWKSWTPFKVAVVVGTVGDFGRAYWTCSSYRNATAEVEGRISAAKARLAELRRREPSPP